MLGDGPGRLAVGVALPARRAPHTQEVVVAAAGQQPAVRRPGQPADLLAVSGGPGHQVLRHPHVAVVDGAVPRPAGEDVLVPGQRGYTGLVAGHDTAPLTLLHVPQLNLHSTHTEVLALNSANGVAANIYSMYLLILVGLPLQLLCQLISFRLNVSLTPVFSQVSHLHLADIKSR